MPQRVALFADTNSDSHAYGNAYSDIHTDADTERNSDGAKSYCDAYTDSASSVANRDRDRNIYTYFDTETFTDAEDRADAQGSPHSGAAPLTFKLLNQ